MCTGCTHVWTDALLSEVGCTVWHHRQESSARIVVDDPSAMADSGGLGGRCR